MSTISLSKQSFPIGLLIFLSGFAALSWEVVWQIKTSLALGVSAWGTAITLAVTMGGMALGALLAGSILKKKPSKHPLKLYGILELVIGISGLSLLITFDLVEMLDTAAYQINHSSSFTTHILGIISILGLPALCLGATLPVIGLIAAQNKHPLSLLYGLNTLGAAIGCLLSAFILIPNFGINGTIMMIAVINILVGMIALLNQANLTKVTQAVTSVSTEVIQKKLSFPKALIVVFMTGFITFVLEIAWFRSLTAAFLSTSDAFAIMLSSVLIALGLASQATSILRRIKSIHLGSLIGIAGVLVLISTPLIERFDYVTHGAHENPIILLMTWFSMSLFAVGIPIFFIGIALPWILDENNTPKEWGILYGLNAFASILGAVCAAWILLPTIGFAKTSWFAGLILIFLSFFLLSNKNKMPIALAGILAFSLAVLFESGVGKTRVQGYFYHNNFASIERKPEKILAYDEGPNATISVVEYDDGYQLLAIDGFVTTAVESKRGNSASYMAWMGHLPMILHPNPQNALLICFGTGQTAHAIRQENPQNIDMVDINPQVYNFAPYFSANERVLKDPRSNPIIMDGRSYIRRTKNIYDIITLEPMPPSFAGTNALYSKEFYREAYNKLSDDGYIAQWVPFHIITPEASASIAKTLQSVFPNTALWIDPLSSTGILVGSKNNDIRIGERLYGFNRTNIQRSYSQEKIKDAFGLDRKKLEIYGTFGDVITDDNQLLSYGRLLHGAHKTRKLDDLNFELLDKIQNQK